MILDPKIKQGLKPLDCYDVETAKKYIGKRGFFFDTLDGFIDLSGRCVKDVLGEIDETFSPFYAKNTGFHFSYFLPEEFCNDLYRPYNLAEFLQEFSLSKPVKFRQKRRRNTFCQVFLGYREYIDSNDNVGIYVSLGATDYTLQELFDEYEVFTGGAYRPFGKQA